MSKAASESDPQSESTLYNPPTKEAVHVASHDEEERLHLELPEDLARRLLDVAQHLGLSPSMVASRAVDLVCDEVGLVEEQELSSGTLIQKYQTRLDLLHTFDLGVETQHTEASEKDSFGWDAVDEIIESGEEARH